MYRFFPVASGLRKGMCCEDLSQYQRKSDRSVAPWKMVLVLLSSAL